MESTRDDPDAPPPISEPTSAPRLSLPFHVRLPVAASVSFLTGSALGLSHGSQSAGLRFRAENAHRLPQTPTGWYLYHKSKNYHMALGGVKEGFKMGGKVSIWVGGFFTVEEAVDRLRGGRRDFFSTVIAGLGMAGGFSLWNRFPLIMAARTARTGLLCGLAFGLVQDALSLARGRRLAYVDFLLELPPIDDEYPSIEFDDPPHLQHYYDIRTNSHSQRGRHEPAGFNYGPYRRQSSPYFDPIELPGDHSHAREASFAPIKFEDRSYTDNMADTGGRHQAFDADHARYMRCLRQESPYLDPIEVDKEHNQAREAPLRKSTPLIRMWVSLGSIPAESSLNLLTLTKGTL